MQPAPVPQNEERRAAAVRALRILDTPSEERFDRITRIAQLAFDVPYVYFGVIIEDRVWIKSCQGIDIQEVPRDTAFCGHTICKTVTADSASRIMEVCDARQDKRFFDNPYVLADPPYIYYLGFVLQSKDQQNVGALCIVDTHPRNITPTEKELFIQLGFVAEAEIQRMHAGKPSAADHVDYLLHVKDSVDECVQELTGCLKRTGISVNEWRVLHEIMVGKLSIPNKIANRLHTTPSSVTRLLDLLESKGFIERNYGAGRDRRLVKITCTASGQRAWNYGHNRANTLGEKCWQEFNLLE